MIASDPIARQFDAPWRRLAWLTPSALLLWAFLLLGFALLLQSTRRAPETVERLDARLLEIPAAPEPGGLQGEPSAEPPAPVAAPPVPLPPSHVEPRHEKQPPPRPKVQKPPAPASLYDTHGAHTAEAAPGEGPVAEQAPADGATVTGGGGAGHGGGGAGLGSDSIGARALYAPVPTIPDDLREEVFETVAVAHFQVTFDGTATVSLVKPTTNPRLNGLLLDTLRQWKFAPAIRNGVTIDSAFDVRIPIAVQ
jgi:protein TonB